MISLLILSLCSVTGVAFAKACKSLHATITITNNSKDDIEIVEVSDTVGTITELVTGAVIRKNGGKIIGTVSKEADVLPGVPGAKATYKINIVDSGSENTPLINKVNFKDKTLPLGKDRCDINGSVKNGTLLKGAETSIEPNNYVTIEDK